MQIILRRLLRRRLGYLCAVATIGACLVIASPAATEDNVSAGHGGSAIATILGRPPRRPIVLAATSNDAARNFDPIVTAFGVDTPVEFDRLREGQNRIAQLVAEAQTAPETASPEAQRAADVNKAIETAEDDLYQLVADAPNAADARAAWAQCMSSAGTPFDSPAAVEAYVSGHAQQGGEISSLIANRDRCDAQEQPDIEKSVVAAYPAWANSNRELLQEYGDLLGL